jgi:hypothetical protein
MKAARLAFLTFLFVACACLITACVLLGTQTKYLRTRMCAPPTNPQSTPMPADELASVTPPSRDERLSVACARQIVSRGVHKTGRLTAPLIDFVVARFAEDLHWLAAPIFHSTGTRVIVYNKGSPIDDDVLKCLPTRTTIRQLPNIGRDFHTYLTHITRATSATSSHGHHDTLADITVFFPASVGSIPEKQHMLAEVLDALPGVNPQRSTLWPADVKLQDEFKHFVIEEYEARDPKNLASNAERRLTPAKPRPFGLWLDAVMRGALEEAGPVGICGIVAATRASILRRPQAVYRRLLHAVSDGPNPEAGHYVERVWTTLLRPMKCPRVVWLLWLQGWERAPAIVHTVARTWRHHNPAWDVVLLDKHALERLTPGYAMPAKAAAAAQSDLARLRLLHTHGGVWADATMACLRPLDDLIAASGADAFPGAWMYHGRDAGRGPASWFMVARPDTVLMAKWRDAAESYWSTHQNDTSAPTPEEAASVPYFWMDELFANLASKDEVFRRHWQAVPVLYAEKIGSACAFDRPNTALQELTAATKAGNAPFAVKLTHKFQGDKDHRESIAHAICEASLANQYCRPANAKTTAGIAWDPAPDYTNATYYP